MKTVKFLVLALFFSLVSTFSFADKGKKAKAEELKVDTQKSSIGWLGKKVTGEHSGTINVAKGSLAINAGKLTGGSFEIDMKSMACTDLKDSGYNAKLIGHLSSDDFFGTEKFPTASLIITKAVAKGNNAYDITGNFTIKGVMQSISFPATVIITSKAATATASITIDRTKFDIRFGSKSFFESIGDKAIYDDFTLDVKLVAGI